MPSITDEVNETDEKTLPDWKNLCGAFLSQKEGAEEELRTEICRNPRGIYQFAGDLLRQKKNESLLALAIEHAPGEGIRFISEQCEGHPVWMRSAVNRAVEHDPYSALRYANMYAQYSYAPEKIAAAAEHSPAGAYRFLPRIKGVSQELKNTLALKAVEEKPLMALHYAENFTNAAEIAESARAFLAQGPVLYGVNEAHAHRYERPKLPDLAPQLENNGVSKWAKAAFFTGAIGSLGYMGYKVTRPDPQPQPHAPDKVRSHTPKKDSVPNNAILYQDYQETIQPVMREGKTLR